MYLVIHESRDSNRKYIIIYDKIAKKFLVEDELHNLFAVAEVDLFDAVDILLEAIRDE